MEGKLFHCALNFSFMWVDEKMRDEDETLLGAKCNVLSSAETLFCFRGRFVESVMNKFAEGNCS